MGWTRVPYSSLPNWDRDDHDHAYKAFFKSAEQMQISAPKTRTLGIQGDALKKIGSAALELGERPPQGAARRFFEHHFTPARMSEKGFVTGYFEPLVEASRTKTTDFNIPLYRRPNDLVEVKEGNRPKNWPEGMRFAKKVGNGLKPYENRQAIEQGALRDRSLELVYLKTAIDAFFIHIQGSARLSLSDGSTMRVTYAGKTGHDYTPIGKSLLDEGAIAKADMSMQAIRTWLFDNPSRANEVMWQNQSFIFFEEVEDLSEDDGPIGAAKVPLTSGRSLAVDRTLHTFGTPIFVTADLENPIQRLMVAQDTGSAIIGAARGDIFFGTGIAAGEEAGAVQHQADFFILLPSEL